jgi:hypothetical protein
MASIQLLLRIVPRVLAKDTVKAYRGTIHKTTAPSIALQIGLKARALNKSLSAQKMGVSLA